MKNIFASAWAAVISIVLTVIVTIAGDLNAPFKEWLKGFTGHHWVTKSWLSLIAFIICFAAIRAFVRLPSAQLARRAVNTLAIAACVGVATLIAFYLYEYLI